MSASNYENTMLPALAGSRVSLMRNLTPNRLMVCTCKSLLIRSLSSADSESTFACMAYTGYFPPSRLSGYDPRHWPSRYILMVVSGRAVSSFVLAATPGRANEKPHSTRCR